MNHLSPHLCAYICSTHNLEYSRAEHDAWHRLVTALCESLVDKAIHGFLDGVLQLDLLATSIPRLDRVNEALAPTGWAVIAVEGMLPSHIWVDFLAHKISPVVARMRAPDNLNYTPTPDIVHDLFGHTALLMDPRFAALWHRFAQLSVDSLAAAADPAFELIKRLSEVKAERPDDHRQIQDLSAAIARLSSPSKHPSPQRDDAERRILARRLAAFAWWVNEYGLLQTPRGLKVFGASLCSSLKEAEACTDPCFEIRPLAPRALDEHYDATSTQDHLYVAREFADITQLLEHVAHPTGIVGLPAAHEVRV